MQNTCIQDILGAVEKPSRYLGCETNRVHKDPRRVKLRVALAFPDLYEIGTSHFGIQILYHILNRRADIAAEQVFAPGRDLEARLRKTRRPLSSLESATALADFDIIGFSLLYELNYTNVLNMLDLAGIGLRSEDRQNKDPLIIAGGPCVCNPEPMACFFDAMVFGDGEEVILQMADAWLDWCAAAGGQKRELLRRWSKIAGVYIPAFFEPGYDDNGVQRLTPKFRDYTKVSRAIVADLDGADFPDRPVVPFARPVHDRLRLEVFRGCSRGCRFCQAGMIYRPVRERSPQRLIELFDACLAATGYEEVSLLSLSTGDYTCLAPLMEALMKRSRKAWVALSLPSFRAGSLTPALMELIRSVRKTGFTIAPEAGSQRLRDVINKNITYEDVAGTLRDAFSLGWQVIKLYFMIGLPTETRQDLDAIINMVQRLKGVKGPEKRRGQINVSITTFIPKPHTPFQWARQISLEESRERSDHIRSKMNTRGIHLKWQDAGMSLLEGVMARGDRRLSAVIEKAWQKGSVFDGWNDAFDLERWQQAFEACGVDMDAYVSRERSLDEPLPWDHMDAGVRKDFLQAEWRKAQKTEKTEDCRYGACTQCGVCEFKNIRPVVFSSCPQGSEAPRAQRRPNGGDTGYTWREVVYSKLDQARFFGHLEMAKLFARALRRAQIMVEYSRGFHPMPRISFDNPLPLGLESEAEKMLILVQAPIDCQQVVKGLNDQLPQGLCVVRCRIAERKKINACSRERYRVQASQGDFDSMAIERFLHAAHWLYVRKKQNCAGQTIDLKKVVCALNMRDDGSLIMELRQANGCIVRPAQILMSIFQTQSEAIRGWRICKLDCSEAGQQG